MKLTILDCTDKAPRNKRPALLQALHTLMNQVTELARLAR